MGISDCTGIMTDERFFRAARRMVAEYTNDHTEGLQEIQTPGDVYTVWSCKALKNFKGLFGTHVHDGRYFEVTYDGEKECFYFDSYMKEHNQRINLEDLDGQIVWDK